MPHTSQFLVVLMFDPTALLKMMLAHVTATMPSHWLWCNRLDLTYILGLLWENGAIVFFSTLSLAMLTASVQVAKPIFWLSPSTVLLHVSLGRPQPLFPSGAQILLVVHGQYMPHPTPPLAPYLFTDGASPSPSPNLFI